MMIVERVRCGECGFKFLPWLDRCPHCARPGLYPNVVAANRAEEVEALDARYNGERAAALAAGRDTLLSSFEKLVAESSAAVIARSLEETERLASSDNEIYATYYNLLEGGSRVPEGTEWDILRSVADVAIFPQYRESIRFAALTLNGKGVGSYGECFWVLRTDMIEHRASVFEENTVLWFKHQQIPASEAHQLPPGYRAPWGARGRLAVAKLGARIEPGTLPAAFPELLLHDGTTVETRDFVEVHVYGTLTVRSLATVLVRAPALKRRRTLLSGLRAKLMKFDVDTEPTR